MGQACSGATSDNVNGPNGDNAGDAGGAGASSDSGAMADTSTTGRHDAADGMAAGGPADAAAPQDARGSGADASGSHDAGGPVDATSPDARTTVPTGDAGALDAIRQACVDQINADRAKLNLAPLMRATPAQEACSDMGAQKDATTNSPHSSAGGCMPFGAQD